MVGTPPPATAAGKVAAGASGAAPSRTSGRSVTPERRGRSRGRRGGGEIVVREVVRESGGGGVVSYPTLTKMNYCEWAIIMCVQLQGAGLWDAVENDDATERQERLALGAILRSVPPEMVPVLAAKDNAKAAWDAIKVMRVGVDRVREARRQKLRKNFKNLAFKAGESIEDFSLRISGIINELQSLGDDTYSELAAVQKFLRVVPSKYAQMACSIETLLDLKDMTLEELSGRLSASEGRGEPEAEAGGRLLLTEEECRARQSREQGGGSHSGDKAREKSKTKNFQGGAERGTGGGDRTGNSSRGGGDAAPPRRKGECRYCGIPGLWAKECRKKARDRAQQDKPAPQANLAQAEVDQPALLLASCHVEGAVHGEPCGEQVLLHEERVVTVATDDDRWYLDTGARNHMTRRRDMLSHVDETVRGSVKFGDGSVVQICGRGSMVFSCKTGEHRALSDVYYIPQLRTSIVILGQLDENGCKSMIEDGELCLYDRQRILLTRVRRTSNRLYAVTLNLAAPVCLMAGKVDEQWWWHTRYMHLHFRALHDLGAKGMVRGMPVIKHTDQFCQGCTIGKMHRTPFPCASAYRVEHVLDLVHGDLCGPITLATMSGNKYFLLIVDDSSRYMWVEVFRSKDEAYRFFHKIKMHAELQSGTKLRAFRSDRGGEFNSNEFASYCEEMGIQRCMTAPYSPQQNGVVERRNQSVVEMARSLLKGMGVPNTYWGEAVRTAVHILNRSPTRSLQGITPYEAWRRKKPTVDYLRTFGEFTVVYSDIGTPETIASAPAPTESRAASVALASPSSSGLVTPTPGTPGSPLFTPATPDEPDDGWASPPAGESRDTEGVPLRFKTVEHLMEHAPVRMLEYSGLCLSAAEEPASVEEALAEPAWRNAMEAEMESIRSNDTWELSSLPKGHRAIGLKWVFKVKRDPARNIVKHKARLVAKGYAQRQGVDFDEVFAPVARLETVRTMLAMAAHRKWKAPRAWNAKLDASLASLGFERCQLDHALYRQGSGEDFLLVGVYVDDLIITGATGNTIDRFKSQMQELFQMSDLGLLSYYLGIEVQQSDGEIKISQASYAAKILENAGMGQCNPCCTPMENRLKLTKNCGEVVDETEYRSLIGSLRYLVNTRPDLAYAVGVLSRFMEGPGKEHWAAIKQVLRYVKGTQGYGCTYTEGGRDAVLTGFSDSDHAGDPSDRKSTTGLIFFLGPSAVTWSSQKQRIVAMSSCEAEYIAAATAASQGVLLSRLLSEMLGGEAQQVLDIEGSFKDRVTNVVSIGMVSLPTIRFWLLPTPCVARCSLGVR
uniref:Uncharacterized protein n=3 Tax=Avena sativa TaxID=4498 RepID=A0ACD5YKV7_AVESA